MSRNLKYEPDSGSFWCYDNESGNCDIYGRQYDWRTAMGLAAEFNETDWTSPARVQGFCLDGWHLPSSVEEMELRAYAEKSSNKLDAYGFNILPENGYFSFAQESFVSGKERWWSTARTGSGNDGSVLNGPDISIGRTVPKVDGYSVRCVRDSWKVAGDPVPFN